MCSGFGASYRRKESHVFATYEADKLVFENRMRFERTSVRFGVTETWRQINSDM